MSKKAKATKAPKTHVAIVLDKSGSMASTKDAAIRGYNEQVQQLKENAKNGQEILVSLVTFNGDVFEHLWDVPAEKLQEANHESYQPLGSTAMRDAVGFTVKKLLDTTDPNEENVAYLMIIISDGETNADHHYAPNALRELIQSCQSSGKWTFTYLGCSQEYLNEVAAQTSIPVSNMGSWSNETKGAALGGIKAAAYRSGGYFSDRSKGITSKMDYMSDTIGASANFEACVDPDADKLDAIPAATIPTWVGKKLGDVQTIGSSEVFANSVRADWSKYSPPNNQAKA
jgi:uncharacterized protein YegL